MRKRFFSMLGLVLLFGVTQAQTVAVADVEALPGETVEFSLNLSGGKADSYTALSFDVQFPADGFATTGAYAVSESWANTMAVVGDVDATGLATVPFASSNEIAGSDVEKLVSVSFKVDESVATGVYNVTLKNIMFEYGIAEKDYAPDVTFSVNVVNEILLDETSVVMPKGHSTANVRVRRTIKANEWSTICLPFAMTTAQCRAAFGEDVQIADFVDTQSTYDDADNVVGISIAFEDVTAIAANHPYIIKVSQPVAEFTVDGVDIDPAEDDALIEVDNGLTGRRRVVYGGMYGTYHAQTTLEEHSLFLSDNQFWYSTGLTEMKAFRAYFVMADVLTEVEEARARITLQFEEETTTGIREKGRTMHSGKTYNLQGQHVENPRKGLYVKGNRIIFVK